MPKRRGAGRSPLPPEEKQSERVMVTLTPPERARLERAAGEGPLGTYIRRVLIRHLARQPR